MIRKVSFFISLLVLPTMSVGQDYAAENNYHPQLDKIPAGAVWVIDPSKRLDHHLTQGPSKCTTDDQ